MAENKTHWKKLHNPDYLGAYSLMDGDTARELTVTIASVKNDTVTGADGKKDECMVAQIVRNKPFIINATNAKTIEKLYGPYIEDWQNKQITLFVAKVRVAGQTVDALRIRPNVPKGAKGAELPELTQTHEKWNGAVQAITSGATTLEKIQKAYIVSDNNKSALFAQLEAELKELHESNKDNLPEAFDSEITAAIEGKQYVKYFALLTQLKEA